MTRWPQRRPEPVEPPRWFRAYDPAAWPSERDWLVARRAWIVEHPAWDFVAERRERVRHLRSRYIKNAG